NGLQVRVAEPQQVAFEAFEQFRNALIGVREEVVQFDFLRFDAFDGVENDLQRTLEKLNFAGSVEEVADGEFAGGLVAGVPQAGRDAPGAVAQFQLQVRVAIAVDAELLIGDEVDFFEVLAIAEVFDEAAAHGFSRCSLLPTVQTPWSHGTSW